MRKILVFCILPFAVFGLFLTKYSIFVGYIEVNSLPLENKPKVAICRYFNIKGFSASSPRSANLLWRKVGDHCPWIIY